MPQDSKILEIKTGLCKPRAEISLEWLSHKRGAGIAVFSPKAESTLYKKKGFKKYGYYQP